MEHIPCVAMIIESMEGEFLLLLRDDKPDISFPNQWSLAGGRVEKGETPEMAAHRELFEETGLHTELKFWKRYDRQHPKVIVDQYLYVGRVNLSNQTPILGEGQEMRFFKSHDIKYLQIGFEFDLVLKDYILLHGYSY